MNSKGGQFWLAVVSRKQRTLELRCSRVAYCSWDGCQLPEIHDWWRRWCLYKNSCYGLCRTRDYSQAHRTTSTTLSSQYVMISWVSLSAARVPTSAPHDASTACRVSSSMMTRVHFRSVARCLTVSYDSCSLLSPLSVLINGNGGGRR